MKKVVLGMSGGVDSSVSAILLQNQGYEVIGVTYVLTDEFDPSDAQKVCDKLNIKLNILDYRDIFKKEVKDKFIKDYSLGLTPNPCVICNRKIKFQFLYDFMVNNNCDFIATGHYAKIVDGKLYKSADLNKDQTYFLGTVSKEQLDHVLFPLEGISKDEVRKIAEEYGLFNAHKKDSTDVCFITDSFKDYMDKNSINAVGDIVDVESNKIIGKHNGLSHYTIGQRKGLNIGGNTDRLFVVGKDLNKNILYTAYGDDNDYLFSDAAIIENVNWLIDRKIDNCSARFRYRQKDNDVEIEYVDDKTVMVKYPQKIKAVTPGQSCVFYDGDQCLGGGTISSVYRDNKKIWYL